jgi:hypothetical protein
MACKLPPLILHPFADAKGPGKLVDASRANLILHGVIPPDPDSPGRLEERLLAGRYCEISMLFYLGKDLLRWVMQCMDFAERNEELQQIGIRPESFVVLLVEDTPPEVRDKLRAWGVHEYNTIFARALGLHAIFENLPPREILAPDFMRQYNYFADGLFACRQQLFRFPRIPAQSFDFQLYASGEYTRMLEQEWGTTQ